MYFYACYHLFLTFFNLSPLKSLLSVADGVGGWADYGVDPGLYSKQLCSK